MIEELPVLTTPYPALLPEAVAFIAVARPTNAAVAREARRAGEPLTVAVFAEEGARDDRGGLAGLMTIGCAAVLEEVVVQNGQLLGVRARGLARVELLGPAAAGPLLRARVRILDAAAAPDATLQAQLARVATRLPAVEHGLADATVAALAAIADPSRFADALAAELADVTMEQRLGLLLATDPGTRLVLVERLLDALPARPTSELGRVWAALREPCNAVPAHASLRARAQAIDAASVRDEGLRRLVEELARALPILVVTLDDTLETEARRESLTQLTAAEQFLANLRACGRPGDADVEREIAAAAAFLAATAARDRAQLPALPT